MSEFVVPLKGFYDPFHRVTSFVFSHHHHCHQSHHQSWQWSSSDLFIKLQDITKIRYWGDHENLLCRRKRVLFYHPFRRVTSLAHFHSSHHCYHHYHVHHRHSLSSHDSQSSQSHRYNSLCHHQFHLILRPIPPSGNISRTLPSSYSVICHHHCHPYWNHHRHKP